MRLLMPPTEQRTTADGDSGGGGGPNADDYLAALRAARQNKNGGGDGAASGKSGAASQNLAEKIEARRAALDSLTGGRQAKSSEGNNKEVDVSSVKNILKDQASKAEFVKKMSKTFGYGMPSNAEPKTDTLSAEAEKCALLVKSSKHRQKNNQNSGNHSHGQHKAKSQHKSRPSAEARKAAKQASNASREREVQPWDFTSQQHSSVAPINPLIDIEIDPELDYLLAELEQDEEFALLNENEQKTWLESLFFQDTLHCPGRLISPRDRLQAARPSNRASLRLNREGGGAGPPEPPPAAEKPVTAVHVNDKMKQLAQGFFSGQPSSVEKSAKGAESSSSDIQPAAEPAVPSSRPPVNSRETAAKNQRHSVALTDSLSSSPNLSIPSPSLSRKSSAASYMTPPTSRKSSVEPPTASKRLSSSSNIIEPEESTAAAAARQSLIRDSLEEISGVNKNLCSLAQSYFSQQQKPTVSRKSSINAEPPAVARQPSFRSEGRRLSAKPDQEMPVQPQNIALKMEDEKASLVAAFFQGTKPTPPAKVCNIFRVLCLAIRISL
jgi:hypothetical protein